MRSVDWSFLGAQLIAFNAHGFIESFIFRGLHIQRSPALCSAGCSFFVPALIHQGHSRQTGMKSSINFRTVYLQEVVPPSGTDSGG